MQITIKNLKNSFKIYLSRSFNIKPSIYLEFTPEENLQYMQKRNFFIGHVK